MTYRVLVADPPWRFNDNLPGKGRGATKQYATLSVEEICEFPIPEMERDSYLFMWRVSSMVEEAYRVVRAWGFEPKSEIVWEKLTVKGKPWFGMGRHVRASHETCIVATRGRAKPVLRNMRSRFAAPYTRHSGKPEVFFKLISRTFQGPYVELFSRHKRDGWTCLGNQVPEG